MLVTIKGNLGNDPELKFVKGAKGDTALLAFSVAYTPRERKGNDWIDGETIWTRATVWGEKAEFWADHLQKGDTVLVQGSLRQNTFTNKEGKEVKSLEISVADMGIVPKAAKSKKEDFPAW